MMVLVVIGAAAYLYLTRHRRGPDFIAPPDDTDTNAPVGAGTRTHESGPRIAIDDADDAVSDADDQSRVRGDALGIGAAAESAPS
jgi:hypothetical protein